MNDVKLFSLIFVDLVVFFFLSSSSSARVLSGDCDICMVFALLSSFYFIILFSFVGLYDEHTPKETPKTTELRRNSSSNNKNNFKFKNLHTHFALIFYASTV